MTADRILGLYETLYTIRRFEETVAELFRAGELPGFTHSYIGMEAVATGVCAHLRTSDKVCSTHRGHGHCIAKGADIAQMMAELYGRRTGSCKGKAGSMHIADFGHGVLGCNGIVGGGMPMAVGAGLASALGGTGDVAVSFFGDGAVNQGVFHESLNLAAIWKVPVTFVVENNQYTEFFHYRSVTPLDDLAERASAYSIPGLVVDGQDVVAVYQAGGQAVERARSGDGPTLIEAKTYRFHGHYEGEEAILGEEAYRSRDEVLHAQERRDPVQLCRTRLLEAGVEGATIDRLEADVDEAVRAAVEYGRSGPDPSPAEAVEDLFLETEV